jgi:hypothetical protein
MQADARAGTVGPAMNARAVDDAAARIGELRREEREDLGLAAFTLGLAVAFAVVYPPLALPLLLGGFAVGVLGLRALYRQWDLVERLSGDHHAHVISEVRKRAARESTAERRHVFAASIRSRLAQPWPDVAERVASVAPELEALASELDDDELELDPASAVACARLLEDFIASPLLNPDVPPDELRSRVRQIRSGFRPSRVAARAASGGLLER